MSNVNNTSRALEISKMNIEKTKKDFHHNGQRVWNNTPNEISELALIYKIQNGLKICIEPARRLSGGTESERFMIVARKSGNILLAY